MTHAQWTAFWWSRALSQLTAQAATNKESLSVQDLLSEFLEANRISIEDPGKVGKAYDAELWESTAERCKRSDKSYIPGEVMGKRNEDTCTRVRAQTAASSNRPAGPERPRFAGQAQGVSKSWSSEQRGVPPAPPAPASWSGWKSKGKGRR